MGRFVKVLLIANLCLWIYFGIGFSRAAHPYKPNPLGHPAGTGYTFWGRSIAVTESGLKYNFFKTVFYPDMPSFILSVLIARIFDPQLISMRFFAGVSMGGWTLVGAMLLSFVQWYLIGLLAQELWRKWSDHLTSNPSGNRTANGRG